MEYNNGLLQFHNTVVTFNELCIRYMMYVSLEFDINLFFTVFVSHI